MQVSTINRGYAVQGYAQLVSLIIAAFRTWNEARITRRELGRLSDRELQDIGLLRSDIETVGAGAKQ